MLKKKTTQVTTITSTAKTADQLLGDLMALIKEDPKRLNMNDTVCVLNGSTPPCRTRAT